MKCGPHQKRGEPNSNQTKLARGAELWRASIAGGCSDRLPPSWSAGQLARDSRTRAAVSPRPPWLARESPITNYETKKSKSKSKSNARTNRSFDEIGRRLALGMGRRIVRARVAKLRAVCMFAVACALSEPQHHGGSCTAPSPLARGICTSKRAVPLRPNSLFECARCARPNLRPAKQATRTLVCEWRVSLRF